MAKGISVTALAMAGCGGLGTIQDERLDGALSFSHGGISYDHASKRFSGAELTPVDNMPVSGVSVYTGDYTYALSSIGTLHIQTGEGSATLTANFGAATATLDVSGDLEGRASGIISGNSINAPPPAGAAFKSIRGKFYGKNAQKAAGAFAARDQNDDSVSGRFIVTR